MRSGAGEILFIDDDDDLRSALADLLEAEGRLVLTAGSLGDVEALGSRATACSLAIIDVNLGPGQPDGFDALAWLKGNGFRGKAVFLTGHARSGSRLVRDPESEDVPLLSKPLAVEELLELVASAP